MVRSPGWYNCSDIVISEYVLNIGNHITTRIKKMKIEDATFK